MYFCHSNNKDFVFGPTYTSVLSGSIKDIFGDIEEWDEPKMKFILLDINNYPEWMQSGNPDIVLSYYDGKRRKFKKSGNEYKPTWVLN